MMAPRLSLAALAAAALLAASASAQTVVPLDDALDLARTRSIDVLRASATVASARASAEAVDDRRWPSLSLTSGAGQRYGLAFDQTVGGLTQSTTEEVDVGLRASYVVFDGFERRAQARSTDATLRAAELDRAQAEQRAVAAVLQGYLAVAQAEAARVVAASATEAAEELMAQVETLVAHGARPAVEVSQQRERVAAAQARVLMAERDAALAEAGLVRLLGLEPAQVYAFPSPTASGAPVAEVGVLIDQALAARPDLRAASVAVEAAEADGRAARAGRLPQVALSARVGTSYSSASPGFVGQFGDNRGGGVGVSVSLPIFDRGTTRERTRLAEARAQALRAEADDARRAVALDVREAHVRLTSLEDQAAVADVRVEAADAALAAERARYAAGAVTLQAVSLAESRAVEARAERERLRVSARFQRLLLDVAVGDA